VRVCWKALDLIELGHVATPRDRDLHATRSAAAHPSEAAGFSEERENVFGVIRERVSRVVTPGDYSSMAAPVGVEAPSDEILGPAFQDFTLPRFERDSSCVLATLAVLREQCRPTLEIGGHDHGLSMTPEADTTGWQQRSKRRADLFDTSPVRFVQIDFEPICARESANVPVAKIDPEQVTAGSTLLGTEALRPIQRIEKWRW